ncbi:hypothetical protein D3C81_1322370 [compost metagenome]
MLDIRFQSPWQISEMARPSLPARPVRPMRCTYSSPLRGMSKLITRSRPSTSRPRAATSVATRIFTPPCFRRSIASLRSFWSFSPCSTNALYSCATRRP